MKRGNRTREIMLYLRLKCEPKIKKKRDSYIRHVGSWGKHHLLSNLGQRSSWTGEWEKRWNSGRRVNRAFNKSGLSNLGCSYKTYVIYVQKRSFSFFFVNKVERFVVGQQCLTEKAMAPYSSTLAWKIPWMEEPGRLQSMGLLRVRHD